VAILDKGPLEYLKHPLALILLIPSAIACLTISYLLNSSPLLTAEGIMNHGNASQKKELLLKLRYFGEAAAPYMLKGLKDSNGVVRIYAVGIFGRINNPDFVPQIGEMAIGDPVPRNRLYALIGLSRIKDKSTAFWLEKFFKEEEDPDARATAAFTYAQAHGKDSIPFLKNELYFETNEVVKMGICRALGLAGDDSGFEVAMKGMESDDHQVRCAAFGALGDIGRREALPELKKNLKEGEYSLPIKKIEYKSLSYPENVEMLKNTLDINDFVVSDWAAWKLVESKRPEAIKYLKEKAGQGNEAAESELKFAKIYWLNPNIFKHQRLKSIVDAIRNMIVLLAPVLIPKHEFLFWMALISLAGILYGLIKMCKSRFLTLKILAPLLFIFLIFDFVFILLNYAAIIY
jgi:hypothetical protein